jgi:L,D-transpeptidase ErfK/SrfK
VGALTTYVVEPGDTLLDIARHFDIGYNEIVGANPGVDVWLPPPGEVVVVPTEFILPRMRGTGIAVNIPEMRLYHYHGGKSGPSYVTTFPVGLGRDDWRTPQGPFRVQAKTENPTWVIPESIRQEHIRERGDPRTFIAGGDPENPLGRYRLSLSMTSYALHGSNMPWGVGRQVSHGCIRLYNEDIARLYHEVPVGTHGEFLYQPVKLGVRNDALYVEVHADIYNLRGDPEVEVMQTAAELGWADRIDRPRLRRAIADGSGLPVLISRESPLAQRTTAATP